MSALDINKHFYNQDNCTITVAGHCKPIDAKLKENCLGTPLPYDSTFDGPIIDDVSHVELQTWAALRTIPICWDKLKIFLCTVYVPECQTAESSSPSAVRNQSSTSESSRVVLPERGMCLAVRKACPLLFSGQDVGGRSLLGDILPRFLRCDVYAPVCRQNKLRPKIFDANKARCQSPLVSTTNSRNWVKGIATCAFPCRSPVYRSEHYSLARNLVFVAAITGILVNVGVLCTLQLIRPSTSPPRRNNVGDVEKGENVVSIPVAASTAPYRRLPYTALSFIHLAFLVGCIGLLMPHLPGMSDTVACRADGSVRVGEPQTQEGSPIPCVICFMLVYVPMLAVALWSNVLDYALFTAFHAAASRINTTTTVATSRIHRRPLLFRRRRWSVQPMLLLPPDSCELPKRRLGDNGVGGINEAMERSVSPASPSVYAKSSALPSSVQLEEKASALSQTFSRSASWKPSQDGNHCPPLVYRVLYPTEPVDYPQTNHVERDKGDVLIGQRATAFNSMGSEVTCIHIAAFAIPVVFALISLTASEIDGEPLSGLCLVGVRSLWAYLAMVATPITLCLFLKAILLGRAMQSMRKLCASLMATYSPVDREMANRFTMCFRAYVIWILLLTALMVFSAGVHAYAYVEEPKWLESQRLFLFSQLRHRLAGLDGFTACRMPFASGLCFFDSPPPPPLSLNTTLTAALSSSGLRVRRDGRSLGHSSSSVASDPDDNDVPVARRPLTGPLFLNLFTYLMVNLVFASMCLLDSSVKVKWHGLLHRVASFLTECPKKSTTIKTTSDAIANMHHFRLPPAFSWWDPGIFFHAHEALRSLSSVKVNNDDAECPNATGTSTATFDASCGCNRRYSSSTNEESWMMSSITVPNPSSKVRGVGENAAVSVVSSNALVAKAEAKQMHKSSSLNSSQSLIITHRRNKSRSFIGRAVFNPSFSLQQGEGVENALEHNMTRSLRRSRCRKMWVRKTSGRRSFTSRSFSTLGVASEGGGGGSFNSLLLHRAASSNGERILNGHQDLSLESLSRLCATAAAMELKRSRLTLDGHVPRVSTAASWTRRSGTNSRLSLASSSGAESYNSFQLLAEQSGATWRELWRTRLLLIDALRWAQCAVAASAHPPPAPAPAPPPPPAPPLQSPDQQQQQLIATTSMMMTYLMGQEACCNTAGGGGERTPDSVIMAALVAATAAAQVAMQQSGQMHHAVGTCPPALTPLKQMSHMEAPLTTAAFPTLKKCQPDLLVTPHRIYHHPQSANTASTTAATVRGVRRDAICHLDASTAAEISTPAHTPLPVMQHHRLPLNHHHQHPYMHNKPPQRLLPGAGADIWSVSTTSPSITHFCQPPHPPPPPPYAAFVQLPPPSPVIMNANSAANCGECVEGDEDDDEEEEEEGSDAFDSEDEVISTSGEEAAAAAAVVDDYWEAFPTPEGQPSCAIAPALAPDTDDGDDISSVSRSASQIVVADAEAGNAKTYPKP